MEALEMSSLCPYELFLACRRSIAMPIVLFPLFEDHLSLKGTSEVVFAK